jgi:hypothetical protein
VSRDSRQIALRGCGRAVVLVAGMLEVAASTDLWEWERWVVERRCFGNVARRGIGDL